VQQEKSSSKSESRAAGGTLLVCQQPGAKWFGGRQDKETEREGAKVCFALGLFGFESRLKGA